MADALKTCANCRYFQGNPAVQNSQGDCRRHPPTAVMISVNVQSIENPNGKVTTTPASIRPPVLAAWWCGEWQQVETNLVY